MLCILCLLSEKTGAKNLLSQNFHLGKKNKHRWRNTKNQTCTSERKKKVCKNTKQNTHGIFRTAIIHWQSGLKIWSLCQRNMLGSQDKNHNFQQPQQTDCGSTSFSVMRKRYLWVMAVHVGTQTYLSSHLLDMLNHPYLHRKQWNSTRTSRRCKEYINLFSLLSALSLSEQQTRTITAYYC